jgi:hypothetical protein
MTEETLMWLIWAPIIWDVVRSYWKSTERE